MSKKCATERVTFIPLKSFTGWPNGYESDRQGTQFAAGTESIPVPPDFAALMREKGLAADEPAAQADGE